MSPTAVFSCTSEPRNVMVTVVDKLERQGLVARMPHPGDRRAFAVTLTDKARELLPALDAEGRAQEDETTAVLTAAERKAVRTVPATDVRGSRSHRQACTPNSV